MITVHLIANAHLDPVWLWDAREGLNEGISTCHTILNLMDEFPDLTFIRGEAAIYDHIEKHDPETFERIRLAVEAGRWDIVGGTWIQPDTNLTSAAILLRHFERGRDYFQAKFNHIPRIAWAADSFGHSAGLPTILAAAGMTGFAFTRPFPKEQTLPSPAFWWEGPDGSRVLAYRPPLGWYGCERTEMARRLDDTLKTAQDHGLAHAACFYGLGNHGGGPTRRLLRDIAEWSAEHPEIKVVHSGLHRFFAALAEDNERSEWPTFRGELGYCLRGCYASALRIKTAYRASEAALSRAESLDASVNGLIGASANSQLREAADAVLFNSFHDILPGSSIERALDEQLQQIGLALHHCRGVEFQALNALASRVDTSVPHAEGDFPTAVAFLVWNPHPQPYSGHIELENCLDGRPIFSYDGKYDVLPLEVRGPGGDLLPFQRVRTEHDFLRNLPWRMRVLVPVELPPLGWSVYSLGWVEGAGQPIDQRSSAPAEAPVEGCIDNGMFKVEARVGSSGVSLWRDGQPLLEGEGLGLEVRDDPWGPWGGLSEEPESLLPGKKLQTWQVEQISTLESGPERAVMWVRLSNVHEGGASWIDLTFSLYRGREAVDVAARLRWNERAKRLKLVLPLPKMGGEVQADFEVPAAIVHRHANGEVPGGRWVRVGENGCGFSFVSDSLYSFELRDGALRPTIVRSTRYAAYSPLPAEEEPWVPALDGGEFKFRFILAHFSAPIAQLARNLEMPPLVQSVPPAPGKLPRSGSVGALSPAQVRILSLRKSPDGSNLLLRAQNTDDQLSQPILTWQGAEIPLGPLRPFAIGAWTITTTDGKAWGVRTNGVGAEQL